MCFVSSSTTQAMFSTRSNCTDTEGPIDKTDVDTETSFEAGKSDFARSQTDLGVKLTQLSVAILDSRHSKPKFDSKFCKAYGTVDISLCLMVEQRSRVSDGLEFGEWSLPSNGWIFRFARKRRSLSRTRVSCQLRGSVSRGGTMLDRKRRRQL